MSVVVTSGILSEAPLNGATLRGDHNDLEKQRDREQK